MIISIRYSAYCALLCLALLSTTRAQGTAFTYQGHWKHLDVECAL